MIIKNENEIFEKYMRLVPYVYHKYIVKNDVIRSYKEDIYQEGYRALLNAIRLYKDDKNTSFITYAVPAIKYRMVKFIDYMVSKQISTVEFEESYIDDDETAYKRYSTQLKNIVDKSLTYNNINDIFKSYDALKEDLITYIGRYKNTKGSSTRLFTADIMSEMLELYANGMSFENIAKKFGVSRQRIDQLFKHIKDVIPKNYIINYNSIDI